MVQWMSVPKGIKQRLYEVKNSIVEEPVEIYADRYKEPAESLHPITLTVLQSHIDEILCEFEEDSTLLLFGSGHSIHANTYHTKCPNIREITAMDMVSEAKLGLHREVMFIQANIFEYKFEKQYDYVFTSHTIEHFTRAQLANIVLPKLINIAKKALVVLVPYGDYWGTEPLHCCRFYENDEMAELATRYKKIRDGYEIVYWIEGNELCLT